MRKKTTTKARAVKDSSPIDELHASRTREVWDALTSSPPDPEPSRRSLTWIAISFTDFERAVIDELFRIGGFARLDDLVVAGLWQLAKQLDVPVTTFQKRGKHNG